MWWSSKFFGAREQRSSRPWRQQGMHLASGPKACIWQIKSKSRATHEIMHQGIHWGIIQYECSVAIYMGRRYRQKRLITIVSVGLLDYAYVSVGLMSVGLSEKRMRQI